MNHDATDQTTIRTPLFAVPIAPDGDAVTDLLSLIDTHLRLRNDETTAALSSPTWPEGTPRPAATERTRLEARLGRWKYGAGRFGGELIASSAGLWSALSVRAPRSRETLLSRWALQAETPAAVETALQQAEARVAAVAGTLERHEAERLTWRLSMAASHARQGPEDMLTAAIQAGISALADQIIDTDGDSPLTGSVYHFMASGTQLCPWGDASAENHAGLAQLVIHLCAAAQAPLPALPGTPSREDRGGNRELWCTLIAGALAALEDRVHQEIAAQGPIWRWIQELDAATLGLDGEALKNALLEEVQMQVALGRSVLHLLPEAGKPEPLLNRLESLRRRFEVPQPNCYRHAHAVPEVTAAQLAELAESRDHRGPTEAELDSWTLTAVQEELAELLITLPEQGGGETK